MMPRRRLNARVVQRTTSETMRMGTPTTVTTPASASFVVTGVSTRIDYDSPTEDNNSADECSRMTDVETPSFSEDTSYSQYTEDVDYCACEDIILKRCVNAVIASRSAEDLLQQTAIQGLNHHHHHHHHHAPIQFITSTASNNAHIPSPGRFIGRFQVVKVESIHPFRRGRWICHDYVDNSEYAPRDGYEFFRGSFIKRKELAEIKKKLREDGTIFIETINYDEGLQAMQPVTIVHSNATPLVFMNAPVLSSTYHPILRAAEVDELVSMQKVPQTMQPSSSVVNIEIVQIESSPCGSSVSQNGNNSIDEPEESSSKTKEMPALGDLIIEPRLESKFSGSGKQAKVLLYKLLVIGDLGCGKTSIIKRYVHDYFSQHYRATIGVDFALKVLEWDANTNVRLQLWDIAGQERFGNMTRIYYKDAVGAFIVFDVTRPNTFESIMNWKNDLDAKVQLPNGSTIPCVLLGNKCDQPKEGIVRSANKMNEFCESKGFVAWFETSAKDNINIDLAATTLVQQILYNDVNNTTDVLKGEELFQLQQRNEKGAGAKCYKC